MIEVPLFGPHPILCAVWETIFSLRKARDDCEVIRKHAIFPEKTGGCSGGLAFRLSIRVNRHRFAPIDDGTRIFGIFLIVFASEIAKKDPRKTVFSGVGANLLFRIVAGGLSNV